MGQVSSMVDDLKNVMESDKEVQNKAKKRAELRKRQNSQAFTYASSDP